MIPRHGAAMIFRRGAAMNSRRGAAMIFHRSAVMLAPLLLISLLLAPAGAPRAEEPPLLTDAVVADKLPAMADRLPEDPSVVPMDGPRSPGRYGGNLTMLMARAKDMRILHAYMYARLAAYRPDLTIEPDILDKVDIEDGRIFTLHLRKGHRWSDGAPFTAEDFRYWWQDVVLDPDLPPDGPYPEMTVNGEGPVFEVLDETTVRYTWKAPNPWFLPALAAARPIEICGPAHYLKQFHKRYADPDELKKKVAAAHQRGWAQLHNRLDNAHEFDNPDLPTLQPWQITTASPAERFVFVRNPYFHRVDDAGRQLPYIDRIVVEIADNKIIPVKTGSGESDLQARYLRFDNYTFLKQAEERNNYTVRLWRTGTGAHLALYPNLNYKDPQWRALFRDARFRHALSLGVNRDEINQVVYYGLARESNNTVLPESKLWKPEYQTKWATWDPDQANRLLDEMGLTRRGGGGLRLMPDGRPLEIIVETAGESTEEVDVLELIADTWRKIGVKLFTKPSQLDIFRNRIFAGETMMAIAKGIDNGIATAAMPPDELVPVDQVQYQWPKWGQYFQTREASGEKPDLPEALKLLDLRAQWAASLDPAAQERAWHGILDINADQTFTIGLISGTRQPVVVRNTLRNVPAEAIFNWEPGAQFGIYRPDTFWFDKPAKVSVR